MTSILSKPDLWKALNKLTNNARNVGTFQLMEAAVAFTVEFASAAWGDHYEMRALERALTSKLATWFDNEGRLKLQLWTYDIGYVYDGLTHAAHCYESSLPRSNTGEIFFSRMRALAIAAVSFTIQLAIDEAERAATEMRALESLMIAELQEPLESWKLVKPLSADGVVGASWGPPPEKGES